SFGSAEWGWESSCESSHEEARHLAPSTPAWSLPLDGGRELVRDVVQDPHDLTVQGAGDPLGDPGEKRAGQLRGRGGHGVDRLHDPNADGLAVHAGIAEDADGPYREEDGEVLPRLRDRAGGH